MIESGQLAATAQDGAIAVMQIQARSVAVDAEGVAMITAKALGSDCPTKALAVVLPGCKLNRNLGKKSLLALRRVTSKTVAVTGSWRKESRCATKTNQTR